MPLEPIAAGPWALVPALLAISLAWYVRDALIGLFVGIAGGAVVYGLFRPEVVGVPPGLDGPLGTLLGGLLGITVIPELVATSPLFADPWYVKNVLLALFAIGGLMGLMIRAGAIRGVLEALASRVESPADAEKASFLAGVIIHIDDYFNCLVVGSMMRPLTDEHDVSRAKLAYYVDSAGSPAARLAFYSTWGVALVGFIGAGITAAAKQNVLPAGMSGYVTQTGDGLQAATDAVWPLFFNTLGFAFYSWVALVVAALVAWQVIPNIFEMGEEEERARNGGGVVGPDDDPLVSDEMANYEMYEGATPDWRNFAIPVLTIVGIGLLAMFWRSSPVLNAPRMTSVLSAFGSELLVPAGGPWSLNIGEIRLGLASMMGLLVGFVLFRARGDIPSNADATDAMVNGFKGIFLAAAILTLAITIQNTVSTLGISSFVTDWFQGVPVGLIPVLVFAVTAFVSFSDGSSWATYGIMFPIVIPVAFTTGANLPLALGAVLSGGIFGDHCSPISDTTVLSSSTSGADHMVHVKTQIPYALICAAIAGTLFLVLGFLVPGDFSLIPY
ncbi:Na+/H+ antiporter NhaC family protein [Halococcus qingdaonensis]|uniref:Na+/H+ antiporter NhaC family protein n=1 Tax=Halococcus qingdaonensis TaxID=224402 RepID=UPI00211684FC|nr:Na+/H+ antiporter NhaC family protein [Halococcus qingdaonensis]